MSIHILNATDKSLRDFKNTIESLKSVFRRSIHISDISQNIDIAYDPSRGQYNSTIILSLILRNREECNAADNKVIAIYDVDLFIPVLTYVFGEAQLDGSAAVVSTHRLNNVFYGLPVSDSLLMERLTKEIIHELGHTFGLLHCHRYDCVMKASAYVEEIDLKNDTLCRECAALINY